MNTKSPKGTIDLFDVNYEKIVYYKSQLENIFIEHNAIGLETPILEHRENLIKKYGDEVETKLVFNLEDNGNEDSEKYTLRYDLTVPKVRFIQSKSVEKSRIYSIGKVYRRDTPSVGRFREFYQADFDIIGEDSLNLMSELELLKMANKFIKNNNLGEYKILINDTDNLKHLLINIIKIEPDKFKAICSTIDKLDKYQFDELVDEFQTKGLTIEQINLLKHSLSTDVPYNHETREKIDKLIKMTSYYGFDKNIQFTPYMARGLDYYNGIIFEIVIDSFKSTIISGGRYDGLIKNTTLIGISFGLSRMIDLLPNLESKKWKNIYVATNISNEIAIETKLNICSKLELKLNSNIIISTDKKLIKTITWCIQNYIKYLLIIAPDELKQGKVILKDLENKTQELIDLN
jgi:histidyl-tRNA synthetase